MLPLGPPITLKLAPASLLEGCGKHREEELIYHPFQTLLDRLSPANLPADRGHVRKPRQGQPNLAPQGRPLAGRPGTAVSGPVSDRLAWERLARRRLTDGQAAAEGRVRKQLGRDLEHVDSGRGAGGCEAWGCGGRSARQLGDTADAGRREQQRARPHFRTHSFLLGLHTAQLLHAQRCDSHLTERRKGKVCHRHVAQCPALMNQCQTFCSGTAGCPHVRHMGQVLCYLQLAVLWPDAQRLTGPFNHQHPSTPHPPTPCLCKAGQAPRGSCPRPESVPTVCTSGFGRKLVWCSAQMQGGRADSVFPLN